jgi:hypothetical protein
VVFLQLVCGGCAVFLHKPIHDDAHDLSLVGLLYRANVKAVRGYFTISWSTFFGLGFTLPYVLLTAAQIVGVVVYRFVKKNRAPPTHKLKKNHAPELILRFDVLRICISSLALIAELVMVHYNYFSTDRLQRPCKHKYDEADNEACQ